MTFSIYSLDYKPAAGKAIGEKERPEITRHDISISISQFYNILKLQSDKYWWS